MTKQQAALDARAAECARAAHAMVIGNPALFANKDALTAWFKTVLAHEQKEALTQAQAVDAATEKFLEQIEQIFSRGMGHFIGRYEEGELKKGMANLRATLQSCAGLWQPIEKLNCEIGKPFKFIGWHKTYYNNEPIICKWNGKRFDCGISNTPSHWQPLPTTAAIEAAMKGQK